MALTKVEFQYSNGAVKTITALGDIAPPMQARYGDSIASVLGETLTTAKLTNPNSIDPGRITGESFAAAWQALYQAQPTVQANSLQPTIDALTARIATLEAKVP